MACRCYQVARQSAQNYGGSSCDASCKEIEKGWKAIAQVEGKDDHEGVTKVWEEAMEQEGVKRSWVPVFEATDYSPERLAERYAKYMDQSVEVSLFLLVRFYLLLLYSLRIRLAAF